MLAIIVQNSISNPTIARCCALWTAASPLTSLALIVSIDFTEFSSSSSCWAPRHATHFSTT